MSGGERETVAPVEQCPKCGGLDGLHTVRNCSGRMESAAPETERAREANLHLVWLLSLPVAAVRQAFEEMTPAEQDALRAALGATEDVLAPPMGKIAPPQKEITPEERDAREALEWLVNSSGHPFEIEVEDRAHIVRAFIRSAVGAPRGQTETERMLGELLANWKRDIASAGDGIGGIMAVGVVKCHGELFTALETLRQQQRDTAK